MRCAWSPQAALVDLRIPRVEISPTDDPEDEPEIDLDDDPEHATALDTSKLPLVVTVAQVRCSHLQPAPCIPVPDI